MPGGLVGSAPQASFSTQPTILPEQRSLLDSLLQALQGGAYSPGVGAGAGAGPQTQSLQGMENIAAGVGSQGTLEPGAVAGALTNSLTPNIPSNFAAPVAQPVGYDFGAVPQVSASSVSPNAIDATSAFQHGVIDPVTSDFLTRTLPGIAGHYGQGAGGAFSSDALAAREQAGTDTTRALAERGSQFAYDAARANQQASLASQVANQNAGLTAQTENQRAAETGVLATQAAGQHAQDLNIGSQLTVDQINQRGSEANQSAILQALGLAPSVNTLPFGPATADAGLWQALLQGSGMPFTQNLQLLTAMLGGSTQGTQTTTGVGTGGSSGLLPGLFQGLGSAAPTLLTAFSDERLKEDFELVGEVGGFPLYKYRLKGEPKGTVRVGVKAQEVERRLPQAVSRFPGTDIRMVNYGTLVSNALEAA